MLIALAVLLMLSLLGIASIHTSSTDMNIAENYTTGVQAFYIAEAGAEYAFAVLRDTATWRTGFNDETFSDGTFRVVVWDSVTDGALEDTIVVLSTGRRREAVKIVELRLAPKRLFRRPAFAEDNVDMCGNTRTDSYNSDSGSYAMTRFDGGGDVGSNGSVDICGTSVINGDATTSSPGDLVISGSGVVNGDTSTTAVASDIDPISDAALDYAMINSNAPSGFSGTYTYSSATRELTVKPSDVLTLSGGVYYFTNLSIKGVLRIQPGASVQIYTTQNVIVTTDALVNTDGRPKDLIIFSTAEQITLSGPSDIRAAIYAPSSNISLEGNVDLYGSMIGRTIADVGGSGFHYDRSLRDAGVPGELEKVAWRERQ
jgi:hypothetical protein